MPAADREAWDEWMDHITNLPTEDGGTSRQPATPPAPPPEAQA